MIAKQGIEDSVKRDNLSVVDIVPDLPADRALRMEDSDTLIYDALLCLKVIVK
jgi:hypothetical protein